MLVDNNTANRTLLCRNDLGDTTGAIESLPPGCVYRYDWSGLRTILLLWASQYADSTVLVYSGYPRTPTLSSSKRPVGYHVESARIWRKRVRAI